ncbi:MAG TPA: hypothetical protein VMU28_04780 [Terriglobales bacterium]|nr:hypothetical protein [Terriglobales bacterium]
MNTVYESLRTLLRNKELEIKKLEKEIEALRIVLPIVAEAGDSVDANAVAGLEAPRSLPEAAKPKPALSGADFDNVMAQVKSVAPAAATAAPARTPIPDQIPAKARTSWP